MKKVLFVIDSIGCGGAERGLFALLNALDSSKFDIDLLYFSRENEYYKDSIPSHVTVITPDSGMELIVSSSRFLMKHFKDAKTWPIAFRKLVFGVLGKIKSKNYFRRRARDWQSFRKFIPQLSGEYDVAIGYMGIITRYYTIDKVKAKRYILWQRTDYRLTGCDLEKDLPYFQKADVVCVLSEEMKKNFLEVFPSTKDKVAIVPNIFDVDEIRHKGNEKVDFEPKSEGFKIVSVGTLRQVKGYDVAMRACKRLMDAGYSFKWYVLGFGEDEEKMRAEIKYLGIQDTFILLGNKRNPYAYVSKSDIFVQCSYREGFSSTVFEAKCLAKPIVITDAPGMRSQITNGINGFVVPVGDDVAVAKAIETLLISSETRKEFENRLQIELHTCENDVNTAVKRFDGIVNGYAEGNDNGK